MDRNTSRGSHRPSLRQKSSVSLDLKWRDQVIGLMIGATFQRFCQMPQSWRFFAYVGHRCIRRTVCESAHSWDDCVRVFCLSITPRRRMRSPRPIPGRPAPFGVHASAASKSSTLPGYFFEDHRGLPPTGSENGPGGEQCHGAQTVHSHPSGAQARPGSSRFRRGCCIPEYPRWYARRNSDWRRALCWR